MNPIYDSVVKDRRRDPVRDVAIRDTYVSLVADGYEKWDVIRYIGIATDLSPRSISRKVKR